MKRLLGAGFALLVSQSAEARKPEDVFKRQIVIVGKRVPMKFSSAEAMISFFRGNRKEHVWPDKEGKWKLEYMSFFAEPLQDFLVTVKFYDVTLGAKRMVQAYDENTVERGLRTLYGSIVLEKPDFEPNHKYRMVVTSRGRTLAETDLWLRGQGEKFSGKVEFSDQETKEP